MKRAALLVFAVACGPTEDVTPAVPVQPGAAARAMALTGRYGVGGGLANKKPEVDAGAEPAEPPPGRLAFSCLEPRGPYRALARVPCEVTIADRDEADGGGAASTPDAGAVEAASDDVFQAPNGRFAIELEPGAYRVTVGRGPEYARVAWDADVASGKTTWAPNEGAVVVPHVVDTRGYLAVDGAARADREALARDADEGIEVVVGDVAEAVQRAKLDDVLAVLAPVANVEPIDPLVDPARLLPKGANGANGATGNPPTPIGAAPVRTYVHVGLDASPATWSPEAEADVVRALRDRQDVVVTTGPFVRVTANGASPGGVAKPRGDHDVEVAVHVECPPWMTVDRAAVTRLTGAAPAPQTFALHPTPLGGRAADVTFHLPAKADDAFVVTVNAASAAPPATAPRAMTAPLWIDADGDGTSLGRSPPPPLGAGVSR